MKVAVWFALLPLGRRAADTGLVCCPTEEKKAFVCLFSKERKAGTDRKKEKKKIKSS